MGLGRVHKAGTAAPVLRAWRPPGTVTRQKLDSRFRGLF